MAATSNPEAQRWSGDFVNHINEQVRVCSFAENDALFQMLYVVLAAGRPGETGPQDRFFQARKQAQSFPVHSQNLIHLRIRSFGDYRIS
jgi:hypothetical protein